MKRRLTCAVTGLAATDNPAPGVGVIRALRDDPELDVRVVGLAYDTLDSGIYARTLVDDAYLLPYPSQGLDALQSRLREIHAEVPFDVIIPNLDAELPSFIALQPTLEALGVGSMLPTEDQLSLRSKAHLAQLGEAADIDTPTTWVINDPSELRTIDEHIDFPLWIKGAYYGAIRVRDPHEAIAAYHRMVAQWGLPIVAQANTDGDEIDVVAVGDGAGGMVGAVPMRKRLLTDKGKGWAGIAIRDPAIDEVCRRYFQATRWRGPCEIEMVRDPGGSLHLLEINPRFPAWCYLSAGAGMNLPAAVARLAAGMEVEPMTEYRVGTMFVRISLDQIVPLEDFEQVSALGALHRAPEEEEEEEFP
ncbi:MAG: ATP-grasp domain-containing protein [Myxococcales bacterium]|nr:ATP-grasp domain-containing protein [Myxococcales bacterium]